MIHLLRIGRGIGALCVIAGLLGICHWLMVNYEWALLLFWGLCLIGWAAYGLGKALENWVHE